MRLKKLLKASLIVALFSSIAMAASATEKKVSVYGNFDYWYGQYSNSESVTAREEDGSTASETAAKDSYMRDFWQVVSGLKANSGDASANVWFLRRGYFTGNELAFKGWAKYQLADKLSVRAGNSIVPAGTTGATATSGLSTSLTFGMGIIHGFLAYVDSTGIEVEYKLNNYFGIYLDLFSRDPMYQKSVQGVDGRGVLTKLATKGIVCSTCDLKYLYPKDHSFDDMDTSTFQKTGETSKGVGGSGSGMTISFQGLVLPQFLLGGSYIIGTSDHYDGGPTDSSSAMMLTGKYSFSKTIKLAFDYATTSRAFFTGHVASNGEKVDGKSTLTGYGLMLETKIGPGELVASYQYLDRDVESGAADIRELLSRVNTSNSLSYEIPLSEDQSAGVRFAYISDTKTPDDPDQDATTVAFLGAGLYTRF